MKKLESSRQETGDVLFIQGNARALPLADACVHCIVTSPPYWGLRDYGLAPEVWGDGWRGVLGLEPTPEMFVEHMVQIAREWWRVLRDDGTLWMNLGDSYAATSKNRTPEQATAKHGLQGGLSNNLAALRQQSKIVGGLKPKDLVGIPWMVAFALRADGWYLRQDIVWAKPNPMPESVRDRCTKGHEYVFLLTKRERYFIDMHAIREPVTSTGGASFGPQTKLTESERAYSGAKKVEGGFVTSRKLDDASERNHPLGRNSRSVWTISTESFPEAHFATFPTRLAAKCIRAGTSEKGCCPTCGAAWERVIHVVGQRDAGRWSDQSGKKRAEAPGAKVSASSVFNTGTIADKRTTDWRPTCDCPAHDPVPCTVLDPFGGAFTAPIVAAVLGRVGIGVEKKADYIQIGVRRWKTGRERVVARVIGKPVKKSAGGSGRGAVKDHIPKPQALTPKPDSSRTPNHSFLMRWQRDT